MLLDVLTRLLVGCTVSLLLDRVVTLLLDGLLDALVNGRVLERALEWLLPVLGTVVLMLDEPVDRLLEAGLKWLVLDGDVDCAPIEGLPELE